MSSSGACSSSRISSSKKRKYRSNDNTNYNEKNNEYTTFINSLSEKIGKSDYYEFFNTNISKFNAIIKFILDNIDDIINYHAKNYHNLIQNINLNMSIIQENYPDSLVLSVTYENNSKKDLTCISQTSTSKPFFQKLNVIGSSMTQIDLLIIFLNI